MSKFKRINSLVILLVLAVLLNACAQIRKVTYPADFIYLDESLVQTAMLRMSLAIRGIDKILSRDQAPGSAERQRIEQYLSTIDEVTDSLGAGEMVTNHLLIDAHIDEFKNEVRQAIRDVNATPPSFYAAARLSGNCVGCHRYRK